MAVEKKKPLDCNSERREIFIKTLNFLGKKWTLLIIRQFCIKETQRFLELKENLEGINSKLLSQRLKEFEKLEILFRKDYNELSPKVEYTLTKKGYELVECIRTLGDWGYKYNN